VQIGTSLTNIRYTKVPVVTGWKDINFSSGTFYVIDSADSLFAWGNSANNAFGAFDSLGNRSAIDILPISLSSLNAVDLALGNNTTILLSNDNLNNTYLHAWGNNSVGQFGDGTVNSTSSPVLVTQLAKGYTANLFSGGSGSNFRR
jgi:alpha-tubulin suppressor-like RCC1 family protein